MPCIILDTVFVFSFHFYPFDLRPSGVQGSSLKAVLLYYYYSTNSLSLARVVIFYSSCFLAFTPSRMSKPQGSRLSLSFST